MSQVTGHMALGLGPAYVMDAGSVSLRTGVQRDRALGPPVNLALGCEFCELGIWRTWVTWPGAFIPSAQWVLDPGAPEMWCPEVPGSPSPEHWAYWRVPDL